MSIYLKCHVEHERDRHGYGGGVDVYLCAWHLWRHRDIMPQLSSLHQRKCPRTQRMEKTEWRRYYSSLRQLFCMVLFCIHWKLHLIIKISVTSGAQSPPLPFLFVLPWTSNNLPTNFPFCNLTSESSRCSLKSNASSKLMHNLILKGLKLNKCLLAIVMHSCQTGAKFNFNACNN